MTTKKPAQDIRVCITGKHRSRLPGGQLHLSEEFTIEFQPIDLVGGYACLTNLTFVNTREMLRSRGFTPLALKGDVELWIDSRQVAKAALSEEDHKNRVIEWLIPAEERDSLLRTVTAHAEERQYLSDRLTGLKHKKEQSPKYETLLPRLKEEYDSCRRTYDAAALKQGYGLNPETVLDEIAKCEERIFSKADAGELEDLEARFQNPFY